MCKGLKCKNMKYSLQLSPKEGVNSDLNKMLRNVDISFMYPWKFALVLNKQKAHV